MYILLSLTVSTFCYYSYSNWTVCKITVTTQFNQDYVGSVYNFLNKESGEYGLDIVTACF